LLRKIAERTEPDRSLAIHIGLHVRYGAGPTARRRLALLDTKGRRRARCRVAATAAPPAAPDTLELQ